MFSTCVARGIAAKLVYKTVGGKVETSLYCSTAAATPAAAASGSQKKRRKRPDNERRKMKREAWLQRRTVSRPDNVSAVKPATATAAAKAAATATATAAATAAAATAATALEEVVLSSGVRAAAVVDTLTQDPGQGGGPAAPGTASTVPATAAATSPRAWAWEKREGLVAIARRLRTGPLESPEMARSPEGLCDLNLSASRWSEDRELEDQWDGMGSSPTYAAAASKALTAPAATAEPVEEGAELLYQQQQTSAPWYCQFCHCSNHPLRKFCTMCLESKK
jgi:hypothetical protein